MPGSEQGLSDGPPKAGFCRWHKTSGGPVAKMARGGREVGRPRRWIYQVGKRQLRPNKERKLSFSTVP